MKKLITLLLTVCMCLSVGVVLTACDEEHEHTYKTEWSKDATHHWHACEGKDCTDVSDKAEHVWNEGEVTTEATAEADGERLILAPFAMLQKAKLLNLRELVRMIGMKCLQILILKITPLHNHSMLFMREQVCNKTVFSKLLGTKLRLL